MLRHFYRGLVLVEEELRSRMRKTKTDETFITCCQQHPPSRHKKLTITIFIFLSLNVEWYWREATVQIDSLMNSVEHYQCSAFLGDGISQYDMKCHHHLGSVERFWWVVYISAARLNLGSGESSLSTYCSYYWTPWWFWDFLATGEKINRDLSGFWLKDSKKLNIRGISKSIRQFIRHSTTSQRWPVPVGPWTDLTINW